MRPTGKPKSRMRLCSSSNVPYNSRSACSLTRFPSNPMIPFTPSSRYTSLVPNPSNTDTQLGTLSPFYMTQSKVPTFPRKTPNSSAPFSVPLNIVLRAFGYSELFLPPEASRRKPEIGGQTSGWPHLTRDKRVNDTRSSGDKADVV